MHGRHRLMIVAYSLILVFIVPVPRVQADTYVLSGGPSITDRYGVDDYLTLYLNGNAFYNYTCLICSYPPVQFTANAGDVLRITAHDIGGCRAYTALWLHNLATGHSELLESASANECQPYVYKAIYFDREYVLDGSANMPAPLNFRAVYGDDNYTIRLLWNSVPGASVYHLYRASAPSWAGERLYLGDAVSPPFDDSFSEGTPEALAGWWYFIEADNGINRSDWRASRAQAYGVTRHAATVTRDEFLKFARKALLGVVELACRLSPTCSLPGSEFMQIVADWTARVLGPDLWPYAADQYHAEMTLCPVDIVLRTSSGTLITKTNATEYGIVYIEGDILSVGVTNDIILIPAIQAVRYSVSYPPECPTSITYVSVISGDATGSRLIVSNRLTTTEAAVSSELAITPSLSIAGSNHPARVQWYYDASAGSASCEVSTNLLDWMPVPYARDSYRKIAYNDATNSATAQCYFRIRLSSAAYSSRSTVITFPPAPVGCNTVTIRYHQNDGPLNTATSINIHIGRNGWQDVVTPDHIMTNYGYYWEYTYSTPPDTYELNFAMNNGSGVWDNNGGLNWTLEYTGCGYPPVSLSPFPATTCGPIAITYNPSNRPLASAASVYIHMGRNGWQDVIMPNPLMTSNGGLWTYQYSPPAGTTNISMVFNNGTGLWDNNDSADWHFAVLPCE